MQVQCSTWYCIKDLDGISELESALQPLVLRNKRQWTSYLLGHFFVLTLADSHDRTTHGLTLISRSRIALSTIFIKRSSLLISRCILITVSHFLTWPWCHPLTIPSQQCKITPRHSSQTWVHRTQTSMKTMQLQARGPRSWTARVSRTEMTGRAWRWGKRKPQRWVSRIHKSIMSFRVTAIWKSDRCADCSWTKQMVAQEISVFLAESLDNILQCAYENPRTGGRSVIYNVVEQALLGSTT